MPDQTLALHRVQHRVYDLTGLRTGSIRDMLLRSTLLAEALHHQGLVQAGQGKGLLVLGAGPAGMNAAMAVALKGADVCVLEAQPRPFTSLSLATWRRVDPCEYDWPQPHYRAGCFPLQALSTVRVPLPQVPGTGAQLAMWFQHHWLQRQQQQAAPGWAHGQTQLFTVVDARDFVPQPTSATAPQVDVLGPWEAICGVCAPQAPSLRSFGAVLSCVGFGAERTGETLKPGDTPQWAGYTGPRFWQDFDQIPGAGLPCNLGHAIVSGGGDGAMQDVQRLLCGDFGLALLLKLEKALDQAPGPRLGELATPELQRALLAAEDAGRRAHAWQGAQPPRAALRQWHQAFEAAVQQRLAALDTFPGATRELAGAVLRQELGPGGNLSVTWIWRDETPGYAYALNRFLCLVLVHLAQRHLASGRLRTLPGHQIVTVQPGPPHTVQVQGAAPGGKQTLRADLLLVRHGIIPNPLLGGPAVPEQLVPYDLPD